MELTVISREAKNKSEAKAVRREGGIPAILYSNGKQGQNITVSDAEFQKILRSIPKGTLSSKVITLHWEGKSLQAIVKGIEYHPTTYRILHLDLQQLHKGVAVKVKVPLVCTGVADCVGIKLGGNLRQVIFSVPMMVEEPEFICDQLEADVRNMGIGQSMKLGEITIPNKMRPLIDVKEVAVVISKR